MAGHWLTLNDIKHKLISFFENHAQINEVKYEDDFDFNAETELNYPLAQIENIGSSSEVKVLNRTHNIVLADRMDDNIAGIEDDIYSDMEQVAEDFITWLQHQEGWVFDQRTRLNKIINDTGDRIAGYAFQVTLGSVRPQNDCATPLR